MLREGTNFQIFPGGKLIFGTSFRDSERLFHNKERLELSGLFPRCHNPGVWGPLCLQKHNGVSASCFLLYEPPIFKPRRNWEAVIWHSIFPGKGENIQVGAHPGEMGPGGFTRGGNSCEHRTETPTKDIRSEVHGVGRNPMGERKIKYDLTAGQSVPERTKRF